MKHPSIPGIQSVPWAVLILLAIGCGGGDGGGEVSEGPMLVAAASSLQDALPEVAEAFERQTGHTVTLSFGSSGQLATQIEQGAPYDLFLSADQSYVDRLAESGAIALDSVRDYARGSLVLVTRTDAPVSISQLYDLSRPEIRAVAIAEPEFAPYGRAARQVLERAGLWKTLGPKVVRGRSVRQALQYAESGDADAALVAEALVGSPWLRSIPIDADLYDPILQRLGIPSHATRSETARAFTSFLIDGPGRAILADHGFLSPGRRAEG